MPLGLYDLVPRDLLAAAIRDGYVRAGSHPDLPLVILNYTEKAAYEGVWNDATRRCRGLVFDARTEEVVARPFPKFFNHGEPSAPELDLNAPAFVTDKLDGSLGILYPCRRSGRPGAFAVATRGSFTSEQAAHATQLWLERYDGVFKPREGLTYLFEIIAPWNRIVCDYGDTDELVLLAAIETSSGRPSLRPEWPGPRVAEFHYRTLADALQAEPRPNSEGLVVYLPDLDERVKLKQDDYVALHRILTGTNARHVWEWAAVRACRDLVREPKHWATYLGIDPARAAELLEVGEGWLDAAGVPDEFYAWVRETIDAAEEAAGEAVTAGIRIAAQAERIADRRERYDFVASHAGVFVKEVMRCASPTAGIRALEELRMRGWREACPEPTAPFYRSEAVA